MWNCLKIIRRKILCESGLSRPADLAKDDGFVRSIDAPEPKFWDWVGVSGNTVPVGGDYERRTAGVIGYQSNWRRLTKAQHCYVVISVYSTQKHCQHLSAWRYLCIIHKRKLQRTTTSWKYFYYLWKNEAKWRLRFESNCLSANHQKVWTHFDEILVQGPALQTYFKTFFSARKVETEPDDAKFWIILYCLGEWRSLLNS